MKKEVIEILSEVEEKMRKQTIARVNFLIDAAVKLRDQQEQEISDAFMEEVFSLEEEFLS